MPEVRDALERVAAQVAQEPNGFDRVRARRARRERTRRTAAIVVAVATAVAGLTLAATIWSTPSARPVQRPSPPAPSHSASTAARPAPLDLWSLRMVSATAGWATSHNDSGRFSILRTSDGAATWWDVTPPG